MTKMYGCVVQDAYIIWRPSGSNRLPVTQQYLCLHTLVYNVIMDCLLVYIIISQDTLQLWTKLQWL